MGLAKWLAAGLPVTDQPARQRQASFTARFDPSLVRSAADVLGARRWTTQIIDNRPAGRYAGVERNRPALRAGHIPTVATCPSPPFSMSRGHSVWRSADDLAALFAAAGIDLAKPVIAYCGSGVTACTTALAAYMLGREDVAVYDGSGGMGKP